MPAIGDAGADAMPFAAQPLGEHAPPARDRRAASSGPASSTVTARAEPAMRLRHLDPDRAAADDDQMLGRHRGWRKSFRW